MANTIDINGGKNNFGKKDGFKDIVSAEFENYEKMIVSLNETIKLMKQIDNAVRY